MGNIQVMSSTLANQIAAGEVVVRPASCVKELIENSLDAGAKTIHVALREGGISEIAVTDDGSGMAEDDAILSFRRHATSKVFAEHDLVRIRTLGFRGEALASIAAVARVALTTRTASEESAVELHVEGGEFKPPMRVGAPVGTRIEVRDLFYNTPARLKYLRTVQTEQAKSVETVQQAALSRPDVAFTCETEHHVLFQTPGNGDVQSVLASLYGIGEAKQLLRVAGETADYRVTGFIGRPTQARGSRSHSHVFINGRPVRNISIHQAVVQGYRNRIMVGKHPIYALHLEMDPSLVDVNVHPHKAEVRFSEEMDVTRLVMRAVGDALDKFLLAPTPNTPMDGTVPTRESPSVDARIRSEVQPLSLDWTRERQSGSPPDVRSNRPVRAREVEIVYGAPTARDKDAGVSDEGHHTVMAADALEKSDGAFEEPQLRKSNWQLRPVGQALGMYVVADDGESLYIIDQHAAHERILYEEFMDRMSSQAVRSMPMLTPIQLTLTPSVYQRVMSEQASFEQVGLSYEAFGGYDILIRSVPDIWEGLDAHHLATQLFDELDSFGQSNRLLEQMHDYIATRACKAAVKANWYLSEPELEALCQSLTTLRDPFHCPHGRPIFLKWSDKQLEKEFRRIV